MKTAISAQPFLDRLKQIPGRRRVGRVLRTEGNVVQVSGLGSAAKVGSGTQVLTKSGRCIGGEVIQISEAYVTVLPDDGLEGVAVGDLVALERAGEIAPSDAWIGRLIDPSGAPMDGRFLPRGPQTRPLRTAPPPPAERKPLGERLATGHVIFDTLLPITAGQRIGLFAGSGVGKSSLIGNLSRCIEADVIVVALIGERGREVRHFMENVLGPEGIGRSVVVAATSDQSPLLRRKCAWTAMAVAEHFRDQGKSVLLVADSITRFAEAHREIATAAGEAPVLRGFPPSTTHLITSLCERAGPGVEGQGDITAIFSVLVAGSDMDEPIADILRGVLDGHVVLDRDIAERGRFPPVDVLRSVSRSLPAAASSSENAVLQEVRQHLSVYDKNKVMISAGLYTQGSDKQIDAAVDVWPELDSILAKTHDKGISHSFDQLGLCLRRAGGGGAMRSKTF